MFFLLKILSVFILGIIGGIFGSQILWPFFIERPLFYQYRLEQAPVYINEKKEIIIQENTALKNAIEKVEKTIVGIKTKTKKGKILEGPGVILTSDGLILTLADLVPDNSIFDFFLDGEIQKTNPKSQILKKNLKENLAIVKIEKVNLTAVKFADFERLKMGERVFLIGIIFEKEKIRKFVNEGIVKAFSEDLIETNIFETNNFFSGFLFDIEGNLLGMSWIDKNGKIIAIPISKIKSFANF